MATDPAFRGKGVAPALLREMIKRFATEEIHLLSLHVRPENKTAIQLYKSFGFAIMESAQHYYTDGSPAYVMSLEI